MDASSPQRSFHRRLVCRLPSASSRRGNSLNPPPGADLNGVLHRLDGGQQGAGGSTEQSWSSDLGSAAGITTKSHQMMSAGGNPSTAPDPGDRGAGVGLCGALDEVDCRRKKTSQSEAEAWGDGG